MSKGYSGLIVSGVLTAAILAIVAISRPSLDDAQDAFEHRDVAWPTPADFEGWRASGALKCRDRKGLRICEATWKLFSPDDGKPFGKDRVTFACSVSECAWVDP